MDPAFACKSASTIRQQFLASNVVADEIHERTFHARDHFLKCLKHEGVDQQMVYRCEVRTQRYVIEIGVRLGSSQWRINQFLILPGQRDIPRRKFLLQRPELTTGQSVT